MRLGGLRRSSNIEDRRGMRFPGGRGLGLGTLVLALVAAFFGIDPSVVMQMGSQVEGPAPAVSGPVQESAGEAAARDLVAAVLADTEDTWKEVFTASGRQYREPVMVLFRDATPTRCGTGQAAMGPFYCPLDEKIYIDLGFYDALHNRFRAPGDFAQAYVIAHEVGHHVQHLLGVSDQVQQMRAGLGGREGNALSVRLELQADCLAGVWGHHANRARQLLEAGDVEEALGAATAIGDDTLQKQARGHVVPDSFTHGSSAQRVHWFRVGLESGSVSACDTFAGTTSVAPGNG
jgi:predicted metalloprotease